MTFLQDIDNKHIVYCKETLVEQFYERKAAGAFSGTLEQWLDNLVELPAGIVPAFRFSGPSYYERYAELYNEI